MFDDQDFLRDGDRQTEEAVDVLIVKVLEELGCNFEKVHILSGSCIVVVVVVVVLSRWNHCIVEGICDRRVFP